MKLRAEALVCFRECSNPVESGEWGVVKWGVGSGELGVGEWGAGSGELGVGSYLSLKMRAWVMRLISFERSRALFSSASEM